MDAKQDEKRCKQCDHLVSFHGNDGCGTWLLGVRAVPLYRCACVVSPNKAAAKFPVISSTTFQLPPPTQSKPVPFSEPQIAHLMPASHNAANAQHNMRQRLNDLADGLRQTAAELKKLEDTLDNTLRRLVPNKNSVPSDCAPSDNRRRLNDRRRRHYAMIAERRMSERRTVAA